MAQVNYDEISKTYDDVRDADIVLVNHFLREMPADAPLRVLDIGCGTGNYTDLFQRLTQERNAQIYGIDPSEAMIGKGRRKNRHIVFRKGTAEDIPFDDESFNLVFMTDVIHHVPDIHAMFREIHRVLRPAGKVCIVTQSHRQIEARPIAQFFPGTIAVDQRRYPDIAEILAAALSGSLEYLKQEVLFAGDNIELGEAFLELVQKKGYSMLHLLTEQEYQAGLLSLEKALDHGPIQARAAGETLVWFQAHE